MFAREGPLLRATTEYQRVAAFETSYGFSAEGMVADEIEDLGLGLVLLAFVLTDIDEHGIRAGEGKHFGTDQPVVQNDIAVAENTDGFEGQQLWVAGASADQKQFA